MEDENICHWLPFRGVSCAESHARLTGLCGKIYSPDDIIKMIRRYTKVPRRIRGLMFSIDGKKYIQQTTRSMQTTLGIIFFMIHFRAGHNDLIRIVVPSALEHHYAITCLHYSPLWALHLSTWSLQKFIQTSQSMQWPLSCDVLHISFKCLHRLSSLEQE